MNYKNMIKGVVGRKANNWIDSFIKTENAFAGCDNVDLRIDKNICYFKAKITAYGIKSPMNKFTVGGTVCEKGNVYNSVIYDWSDNIIWLSTEETRKSMNIQEKFEIV